MIGSAIRPRSGKAAVLILAATAIIFMCFGSASKAQLPVLPVPPTGSTYDDNQRMYLWNKVVQNCLSGKPSQNCLQVQPKGANYVIYFETKDILLIPTVLISGIEFNIPDLQPSFFLPNFWDDAALWAHYYIPHVTGEQWLGLAINSANSRSQDQLHMHLCTLAPAVESAIKNHILEINASWHPTPFLNLVSTHMYNAMQVQDLTRNPFSLVFNNAPGSPPGSADVRHKADTNMLVAVRRLLGGGPPYFYVLYNQDGGAAESLLNSGQCGILIP